MNEQKIQFFTEGISYQIREKRALRQIIETIIREKNAQPGPINIILCSDRLLKNYNRKYLNRNYFTDIIAFDFSEEKGIISGDLFLSLERIRENARSFHVSVRSEIRRVVIHGILHLTGLKDDSKGERIKMQNEETRFMSLMTTG